MAVLPVPTEAESIRVQDVEISTTRGSGPGGQHRNKTESCVVAVHRPTGLQVRIDSERSQSDNRRMALEVLGARVMAAKRAELDGSLRDSRRSQLGSGMRGDKRRTVREQDDQVVDHVTGRRWDLRSYKRGDW